MVTNSKKQIYTGDKSVKITFRCNDALASWLLERSKAVQLTPSAMVRQLCFQNFYAETALKAVSNDSETSTMTSTETAVKNGSNH